MPYRIEFENDGHGAELTFEAEVSGDEVLKAFASLHEKDENQQLRYQLWDCTRMTHLLMTEDQLRYMAILEKEIVKKNPGQLVVVIGNREVLIGADARYNIYASVWSGFVHDTVHTMTQARQLVEKELPELFR